jgi:hypothetical protein
VYLGLLTLAFGLALTAVTPAQPVPWYRKAELTAELTARGGAAHSNPAITADVPIALPDDTATGWLGLIWILAAMIPASIGGGILQPAINSLITKRVAAAEVGGMLGVSAALLSGANAVAPLAGGTLFQAFGSTAPFLAGGGALGLLLVAAVVLIRPGPEEAVTAGLAHGAEAH